MSRETFGRDKSQVFATMEYAIRYVEHGYSVIPLRLDGTKGPSLDSWKQYSERLPTTKELEVWFSRPAGIGIICGIVSKGLEVLDFDMAELIWPLVSMLPSSLVDRLAIYETPGGWHLAYRCNEICGNRKLASWESPSSICQQANGHRECTGFQAIGKGVRIETRGEGGYIVGEGSPIAVHRNGLPYCHYMGPTLFTMKPIEPSEREAIWKAAMTFDCGIRKSAAIKRAKQKLYCEAHQSDRDESEPWTWFDTRGEIAEILRAHGWQTNDGEHWTRPGKGFGTSATLSYNDCGEQILTVFSTSTELGPINGQAHRSFGAFNLLTAIRFNNDRKEAARYVRRIMAGQSS